jgi:hypothetical protein
MEGSRSERNDGNEKGVENNGRGRKGREWKQRIREGNEIKGRERGERNERKNRRE